MVFASFLTWKDVLAYARTGAPLYYHAPLDYRPAKIRQARDAQDRYLTYIVRHRTIRVFPPGCTGRGARRESDPPITVQVPRRSAEHRRRLNVSAAASSDGASD